MLNSIQTLRAFAAWLVVFHHYMQVVYNFKLQDPISVFLFRYGAIGVDIFFIIRDPLKNTSRFGKMPDHYRRAA